MDGYVEATKSLPPRDVRLETKDNTYFHFKTDIFKREITYSTDKQIAANLVTLSAERVFEVIALNKNGVRPEKLLLDDTQREKEISAYGDIIGQDSVSRFDKKKKKRRDGGRGGRGERQDDGQRQQGRDRRNRKSGEQRNAAAAQQQQGVDQQQQPAKPGEGQQPRNGGGEQNRNNNRRRGGNNRGANVRKRETQAGADDRRNENKENKQ